MINNYNSYSIIDIHKILKKFILLFLLILPFQEMLRFLFRTNKDIVKIVSYFDEFIGIFIFINIIVLVLLKKEIFHLRIKYPFSRYLFIFLLVSLFSIIINKLEFLRGVVGTYDYVKNIAVLYLISSLRWSDKEIFNLSRLVIFVGVCLSIAGIIIELLVLYRGDNLDLLVLPQRRLGLYRTPSLLGTGNINYLGLYCILSLILVISLYKGLKRQVYSLILITNIILTFSRQAWLGLALAAISFMRKRHLKYTLGILLVALVIGIIIIMSRLSGERYEPEVYYRSFTIMKALEIIKNKPFFGSGPGTFGGVISVVFKSTYYNDWPSNYRYMVENMGSIDSFWVSLLTETGLLGFSFLFLFFISLYRFMRNLNKTYKNQKNKYFGISQYASTFILILMIMNLVNGFNKAFLVFTFFSLCGSYISIYNRFSGKYNI